MSSLEQLYQQVILDHSRRRTGAGSVEGFVATSHQVNPTCGDEVTLGVKVDGEGQIMDIAWEGDGCAISQASLSIMNELVDGADQVQLSALYEAMDAMMHSRGQGVPDETLDLLGDGAALEGTAKFANRIKCSLLGWLALRDALAQLGFVIASENVQEDAK